MAVPELTHLLLASREKNTALGITGLLLYSGGNFIQVLEGGEQAVRQLFASILADSRHDDVTTAWDAQILERSFPSWTMGFYGPTDGALVGLDGFSDSMPAHHVVSSGGGRDSDPVRTLLRVFRETMG